MLIDWFTVGAQVLNFLILVWLLKRFLYKPILNAIDAREKRIADELSDANARKSEAGKERDDFQAKSRELDEQRAGLLLKATEEANAERGRLEDQARRDVDGQRAGQEAALQGDRKRLGGEITHMASAEVFAIARKALADLATVSLEERIGEVFTRRLREMDGNARKAMSDALKGSPDPAIIRSTFALPAEQRAAVQNALNEAFSSEVRVRFEVSPDVVCGIELTAGGQKVGWSIDGYLRSLEQKVGALIDGRAAADAQPGPALSQMAATHETAR